MNNTTVNSSKPHAANQKINITVLTDCEADDYLAIFMLLHVLGPHVNFKFIVTAWQNVEEKAMVFKKILTANKWTFPVYYGLPTKKQYEVSSLEAAVLGDSSGDINGFVTLYDPTSAFENADIIVCMSPPLELIDAFNKSQNIFAEATLYLYGSFNIRQLFDLGHTRETVTLLLGAFNRCVLYETFTATGGGKNNLTDVELLDQIDATFPAMRAISRWWNGAILTEMVEAQKTMPWDSRQKIIDSIGANIRQIVNADCGLVNFMLCEMLDIDNSRCQIAKVSSIYFNEKGFTTAFVPGVTFPTVHVDLVKYVVEDEAARFDQQKRLYLKLLRRENMENIAQKLLVDDDTDV